ncbi:MAG: nucleotidyltransferase [Bacillota bacterium]
MKILGIITEYNPFHNGHLYHLKQSKKITSADIVICIMNGNFMQRGLPAVTDKWSRTKMALKNGVDLVIELPLVYGIRSAEYFARGSIKLLDEIKIVNNLVFGSELGDIRPLKYLANLFIEEPDPYQKNLKKYLNQGKSFPVAREKAVIDYIDYKDNFNNKKMVIKNIIKEPNNILGIEYLKSLIELDSRIKPLTIKRTHKNYHSLKTNQKIASATAIRNLLYQEQFKINEIKKFLPETSYQILKNDYKKNKIPLKKEYLGILVLNKIRQDTVSQLRKYKEISNGLENRIKKAGYLSGSLTQLINKIKTKAFTRTRIQRNLLHILFDISARDFTLIDNYGPAYLKILGFNRKGEKVLSQISNKSSLPIITQPAKYLKSINTKSMDILEKQLSFDILASNIYSLFYNNSENRKGQIDYFKPLIIDK